MRFPLALRRPALFLVAFAFALLATLPLRIALDHSGLPEQGLSAREASGSLWLGTLADAAYADTPLGTVVVRLQTAPLLVGKARFRLDQIRFLEQSLNNFQQDIEPIRAKHAME